MPTNPVEVSILNSIAKVGIPTFIATFFIYWFFYSYFPRHEEATERRISEITKESQKNREALSEIMKAQNEVFQMSVREIMNGVARLEKTFTDSRDACPTNAHGVGTSGRSDR